MTICFNSKTRETAFLSNFYAALVEYEGLRYPSVEHAYQAAKTLDPESRLAIAQAPSAVEARRLGKRARLRADWDSIKVGVMRELLEVKFRDPDLRARLFATQGASLSHKAPWDAYWGDGPDGRGQDLLGTLLMELRDHLVMQERRHHVDAPARQESHA